MGFLQALGNFAEAVLSHDANTNMGNRQRVHQQWIGITNQIRETAERRIEAGTTPAVIYTLYERAMNFYDKNSRFFEIIDMEQVRNSREIIDFMVGFLELGKEAEAEYGNAHSLNEVANNVKNEYDKIIDSIVPV